MKNQIITFEQLEHLKIGIEENLTFNGMVITFYLGKFDIGTFYVYRESQSEESDPDPIYETSSITELYNYLNK